MRISLRAELFIGRNELHSTRRKVHFHVEVQSTSTSVRHRLINIQPTSPRVAETLGRCQQKPKSLVQLLKNKVGQDFLVMAA